MLITLHYITLHRSHLSWPKVWTAKPLWTVLVETYKGIDSVKRKVFRRLRNTASVGDEMMSCGKLFHKRLSMTGNARSPTVVSGVRRIVSRDDDDELRERRLESATRWMWSLRYLDPRPCRHRYTSTASLKSIRFRDRSQWSIRVTCS